MSQVVTVSKDKFLTIINSVYLLNDKQIFTFHMESRIDIYARKMGHQCLLFKKAEILIAISANLLTCLFVEISTSDEFFSLIILIVDFLNSD